MLANAQLNRKLFCIKAISVNIKSSFLKAQNFLKIVVHFLVTNTFDDYCQSNFGLTFVLSEKTKI